ncbi:UDP-N-acetylmuramoyl-tripeptide--D-alanyl-D-alanine ligase [Pseudooctadecabacter jejudonensis]|uniref:UDP-N-acetylmuramoyl-tripeptide--D-alanyl-D-alanine ligase n=1 Tax=Pseudooctadecabacter jejudonensis TaxID=1391910 RepID=A0A1Y5RMQ4_9RHOB|nr:UDP-N-acetylmuramoyl-tripeptide--D-alanyl-D-alanine ligase [Pseudooctadecabacter jejudonensis]SLN19958.1 UDP-N-acetylmuramoyl-tripeptide--D-alanyl-D-alanine ligase [Pseudooctadecabacter jejudonensis]
MTLWTSAEAAAATGGQATTDWAATGVSIDTRTIETGDLFVALKAARDGHDFVQMALDKGAAAALVTHRPEGVAEDAPLLIVDDVLSGLESLGAAARARTQAKVLAITGSVGKTSAKEMARVVLSHQGRTHAAEASYNNHWGVPLTLARMPQDTEFAIIEIGMSNPGEIEPLSRLARPHVALVTTVAAAHLEAFEDLTGIAREKASIFKGLEDAGTAIYNSDIPADCLEVVEAAAWEAAKIAFRVGADEAAQYRLGNVQLADGTTIVEADLRDIGPLMFKLNTAGRHFAANGLAILAATRALGGDLVQGALDLGLWQPPAGRGTLEHVTTDPAREETVALIDDAFNANPTSMTAALEVLASYTPVDNVGHVVKGRRVAILGDMLELGADEMAMHAAIADNPHMTDIHLVHCAGPRMRALYDALPEEKRGAYADIASDLAGQATRLVDAGDVVLVKGSKGSKVSLVVDAIRKLGHPDG